MRFKLTLFFLLIISFTSKAQLSDLASVDFTYIPNKRSDVEYTRSRALFNFPIQLKGKGKYLFLGFDYSNIHLRFKDEELPFDRDNLNDFQVLDLTIGYTKPLKNGWRLGVRFQPGISTNNTAKSLTADDIVFSGDIVFVKKFDNDFDKPSRLIVGLSYSQNRGYVFPLPFISYYKKFRPDWSFNIGIPKTNLQYHISDKHRLKLFAQLDGFTSNVQNGALVNDTDVAELINMSLINGGLQYEYHFTDHLQLDLRAAYNFSLSNKLKDGNNNTIFTIDNDSRSYLRAKLKFKI
ncbi:DUF6268 family outer membrane beta-barrel protein [Maribacter hydrothermalis]|uniref:DUF6268 domain-containing protein n=1 Tax=Maribacter hydrothermalis TaxID=1836467 RepID=A0A1B7Z034_9FLAO|nr:DUF6268 family outer membrane beta-barrel protein [Maribacter hydrothermalis]APQ16243.1 hypothetical protein BTR34_02285 [Maribacter hydrothermalis]OBR36069.1 hypothetical protein A9200_10250 [Maribacter hydrothermalis]